MKMHSSFFLFLIPGTAVSMELPVEQELPNSDQESMWLKSDLPYPCAISNESDRALYNTVPEGMGPFVSPCMLSVGDYLNDTIAAVSSYPKWPKSMRISDDGKYACGMGARLSPSDTFYCVDLENDSSVAPIPPAPHSNIGWVHAVFLDSNTLLVRDRKSLFTVSIQSLIAKNTSALKTVYTPSTEYPFVYEIPAMECCDDHVLVIASGQNAIDSMKKVEQQWKVDSVIKLAGVVVDWGCSRASRTFWYAIRGDTDTVRLRSMDSDSEGTVIVRKRAHRSATFSPDGRLVLFAAYYGDIFCIDVRQCAVMKRIATPGAHHGLRYIAWKEDHIIVQSACGKRYDSLVLAGYLEKAQEAIAQKTYQSFDSENGKTNTD